MICKLFNITKKIKMGFIYTCFAIITPAVGYSCYLSFKLGKELPKASRKLGNHLGMSYRYFKKVVQYLKPDDDGGQMMTLWKKSSFMSMTLARETSKQFLDMRENIKKTLPEEVVKNPYERFSLKQQKPIVPIQKNLSGALLIKEIFTERETMIKKKQDTDAKNKFFEEV